MHIDLTWDLRGVFDYEAMPAMFAQIRLSFQEHLEHTNSQSLNLYISDNLITKQVYLCLALRDKFVSLYSEINVYFRLI